MYAGYVCFIFAQVYITTTDKKRKLAVALRFGGGTSSWTHVDTAVAAAFGWAIDRKDDHYRIMFGGSTKHINYTNNGADFFFNYCHTYMPIWFGPVRI